MPRTATIVTPDVPELALFIAAAFVRVPDVSPSPSEDLSDFAFFIDTSPTRPALTLTRPTLVLDRREVTRILQVDVPGDWEPTVLTQCLVPHEKDFDPLLDVALDVAAMSGGFLVLRGRVVPLPQDWPWHRGADGRWVPDPQALDGGQAGTSPLR